MGKAKTIKAFRDKARQLAIKRKDLRFVKTMGFLKAKRLLDTNLPLRPMPRARIDVEEALWAARHVEPRILEVLPAAILHFRANFVGLDRLPENLRLAIQKIERDEDVGPDVEGIEYKKMKFWANINLPDRRTKPIQEKRRAKLFRLKPETLIKIQQLVKSGKFKNQTEVLEAAIKLFKE